MKQNILFILFVIVSSILWAGSIRHDVEDSLYMNLGNSSAYASVGRFMGTTPTSSYSASGVLIASNWVLTAAHVVDQATSLNFTIGNTVYSSTQWIAHSNWDGNASHGYDIALVKLDTNVSGIVAAQRYKGTNETGKVATYVGYGMTGTGLTGATTFDAQKRAGQNVIDGGIRVGKTTGILLSDFDNPLSSSDNSYGSSTPLGMEYLIAPGDSGGGVFIQENGIDYLAGINSFGWGKLDGNPDSDYGDVSGATRVSIYNKWIDSIIGTTSDGGSTGGKGGGKPRTSLMMELDMKEFDTSVPEPASILTFFVSCMIFFLARKKIKISD